MKKSLYTFIAFFTISMAYSQDICESIKQLNEGALLEYTDYDKKGKAISTSSHVTKNISTNGRKVTASVEINVQDLKNKNNTYSNEYDISCDNGIIAVDMMRFFDAERMSAMGENMEVQVDGNSLDFPPNASIGDTLDDGSITVSMASSGVTVMTMTLNIINRKVVAKEPITTPAGTFDCKKMTYDFNSKMGIINVKGSAEQWYTDDQVMVQSVTINKKGKELGKTVLTKLN